MNELKPLTAVITGASSGIGFSTALRLAEICSDIIVIARNQERLKACKREVEALGAKCHIFVCDLSDEKQLDETCKSIISRFHFVDILVNCAGQGSIRPLADISIEEIRRSICVPYSATVLLTKYFLSSMLKQNSGSIINVISPAALFELPYMSVYTSARTGVLGFSNALREEISDADIHVGVVCPSWVKTPYLETNQSTKEWLPSIALILPEQTPELVADKIFKAIKKKQAFCITDPSLKLMYALDRYSFGLFRKLLTKVGLYQPSAKKNKQVRNQLSGNYWTNWEESIDLNPGKVVEVKHVSEIQSVVKQTNDYPSPIRAAGSRHSTSHCGTVDKGTMLLMRGMEKIKNIDTDAELITVEAGALYIDIAKELEKVGFQFHVNVEIGNLTMGSAACTGTKDASMPDEFGQVRSYCFGMSYVNAEGDCISIDEEADPNLMSILRSSYGMLGVIYEVTFKIKPIQPMRVYHKVYTLEQLEVALPDLLQKQESIMYYMLPFQNIIIIEFREYLSGELNLKTRSASIWKVRNFIWKTVMARLGYLSTLTLPNFLRDRIVDSFARLIAYSLERFIKSDKTLATDQLIRYPERKNLSKYTFSIWAFDEKDAMPLMKKYFKFCHDYYEKFGFRCCMPNVGYRIFQDKSAHISYTYENNVMTLDPVDIGQEGWDQFLKAYNQFCVENNARPLLNQTKWLKKEQFQRSYNERLDEIWDQKLKLDPNNRFLSEYIKYLFER